MVKKRTILCVFAHPDDESMGPGATLAKYAVAGHRVAFVTATDGGAGRLYEERPERTSELRMLRRDETLAAAAILGVECLGFLGWEDGSMDAANILDLELEIVKIIRMEKPDVLVTFHGSGISYHADHRVVALALSGAFLGSGRSGWYADERVDALPPHAASKLYYYTVARSWIDKVDWPRTVYASPDEEITTVIDTEATADVKWRAIQAHKTQRNGPPFDKLYEAGVFAQESFVRVFPSWRRGEAEEVDLLEGLESM
jgi:N-acetyl-1-D-myo-inositol-2-amino-2-deoxy-alpha-D-glucopyranoside deacetylase/mycothiol S-conjugate amidase